MRILVKPDIFGDLLAMLGWYYNNAMLCPEADASGLAVIQKLQALNYNRILHRPKVTTARDDDSEDKFGWKTSEYMRPLMISTLREWIAAYRLIIYSKQLLDEFQDFTFNIRKGRYEADSGRHDDMLMATAIALYVYKLYPSYEEEENNIHEDSALFRKPGNEELRSENKTGY